jgi:acyl carrier protein
VQREDVLGTVRDIAVEVLGVEAAMVTEEANLKDDLGADSLDLVEVVMALEERLDVSIPEEELDGIKTVGQAVDAVVAKLAVRA